MSSVADAIEQYGAYAGFAAVVGLSVLALLYFAQAREVKRLREWTLEAADREADVARRLLAQAGRPGLARSIASRTGAMAAIARSAGEGVGPTAAAAAAVAKVADPPTGTHVAASTRPDAFVTQATPSKPVGPSAVGDAAKPDSSPPAGPDGQSPMPAPPGTETPPVTAVGSDTTSAAAKADAKAGPEATPSGEPPLLDGKTVEGDALDADEEDLDDVNVDLDSGPMPAVRTRGARPLRTNAPSATLPPRAAGEPLGRRRDTELPKRGSGRMIGIAAGTVAGIVLAIFAATQLFGGDSTPGRQAERPATTTAIDRGTAAPPKTTTAPAEPANVNVAVLNGTGVTGLAAQIADRLEQAGYVRGNVTNAAVQNRSATIVTFKEGSRGDAQRVAQRIGVGNDAIRPLDPAEASRAGDADVVVIVGADRTDLP